MQVCLSFFVVNLAPGYIYIFFLGCQGKYLTLEKTIAVAVIVVAVTLNQTSNKTRLWTCHLHLQITSM